MHDKNPNSGTAIELNPEQCQLNCHGSWTVAEISDLQAKLRQIKWSKCKSITIDCADIQALDTSGAWLLCHIQSTLQNRKINSTINGLNEQHQSVYDLVKNDETKIEPSKPPEQKTKLEILGMRTMNMLGGIEEYFVFVGKVSLVGLRILKNPRRFQWKELFSIIEIAGYDALPIIALLSFMIGVVLTYQMGLQLKNYGADIYIVDLLGIAILREFASLITSIMVAGRTGSAFTAQLGTMQLNEEIDALRTMGIPPEELLILPRILGLFIVLPLLTMWSNIFGIFGGMVMSKIMLNIDWYDFLTRFQQEVSLNSLLIGIGKSFIFALIIATVGCFEGLQVRGGADSVGKQTTKSVVLAIFLVMVADAVFSVIFSKFNI